MKYCLWIPVFAFCTSAFAQKHAPLPHGMVFGMNPNITSMINAAQVEANMGNKNRINTTIRGHVIKVTKEKGGWFEIDAGKGKIIAAHFKDIGINIPAGLKGKIVIVEGVAEKQFIADGMQHYAGDTVKGKRQHLVKTNPLRRLTFEVKGLMVDR